MTAPRPTVLLAWLALVAAIASAELGAAAGGAGGMRVDVPTPGPLRGVVEQLRSAPLGGIDDPRAAAVASGVIFGRTDHVAAAEQQAFLDSGLWHLLAASGQNIALVAACCVLLARALRAGRTTGGIVALVAIPAYVVVVGGGASIVRAACMGELVLVAWLAGRLADARQVLVVAAAAICWTWPGAHRGLGMQLSFASVVVLLAWAGPMTRALQSRGVPAWLAAAVSATVLCSLATAPLLAIRTGTAPVSGVVANVVAVPIAGALLVTGLAGAVVSVLASVAFDVDVAAIAMLPASWLAQALVSAAHRAASMPAAQTSSVAVAVGAPLLVLACLLGRRLPVARRRFAFGALAVVVAVVLVVGRWSGVGAGDLPDSPPGAGVLRVAVLDVGQGDASIVQAGDHAVLVDTGPPDGEVVRRVRELGIERLDGIVLTHDSLDHRGGFEHALGALAPGWVAMPRGAPGPWQRVRELAPRLVELCVGDVFQVGGARVDVVHPPCDGAVAPRTGDLHNDGAMVLLASTDARRALLPADAEAPVLAGLGLPTVDLLRVAHHGSEDPQLAQLLERLQPAVAAISAGEGNDYGHPRGQVLRELERHRVPARRTDRDGTVVVDLHRDAVVVRVAR